MQLGTMSGLADNEVRNAVLQDLDLRFSIAKRN